MNKTNLALLTYGVILIVGGLMGYYYAGSIASLLSGTISGVVILFMSYLLMAKKPYVEYITLALTILLTVVFSLRFSKTQAFSMIVLTLFSAYVSFLVLLKIFQLNRHD